MTEVKWDDNKVNGLFHLDPDESTFDIYGIPCIYKKYISLTLVTMYYIYSSYYYLVSEK